MVPSSECIMLSATNFQTSSAINGTTYVSLLVKCTVKHYVLKTYSLHSKKLLSSPLTELLSNRDNLKPSELLTPDKTADENPITGNLGEKIELANQFKSAK